jgi:Fe-S-cluster-containing dehydrogenase component
MNELEWGFEFAPENCIQCKACASACKSWRETEPGVNLRTVLRRWAGSYPDVRSVPVSVSCMHCADPACIRACPAEAIRKRDSDGIVLVDREACVGCRLCFSACPFKVPQFGSDGRMQKCDLCTDIRTGPDGLSLIPPPCVGNCPTHALGWKRMGRAEKAKREADLKALLPE